MFATFTEHIHETFTLPGGGLSLQLLECRKLTSPDPARVSFSLIFRGPAAPVLPQKIYSLQSEQAGAMDIFLVPVGPDGTGMLYQAICN